MGSTLLFIGLLLATAVALYSWVTPACIMIDAAPWSPGKVTACGQRMPGHTSALINLVKNGAAVRAGTAEVGQ